MTNSQPKRDWFFWFMALFVLSQGMYSATVAIDFVLNPIAPTTLLQSATYRLVFALIIAPIAIFISVWVLRRTSTNVTGLCLLLWASAIVNSTIRQGSPLVPYSSIGIGWVGLWLLPLFFPDGQTSPPRLSRVIKRLAVMLVLTDLLWTLSASEFQSSGFPNAWYIPALKPLLPLVSIVQALSLITLVLFIVPSMVMRYRRGNQPIRQQMQWLIWSFFIILTVSIPVIVLDPSKPFSALNDSQRLYVAFWTVLIFLAPFIAVGNAILRHRLYDIDIIIRRTLIYALLTVILAVVYFGSVVLVQQLFRALTGQGSDLAIVISTLAIAALFSPLRRRIQNGIDRRLYRRKYDAEKTLEAFNRMLRDEVDMETLKQSLIGVVQDTMQPTHVVLWIRQPGHIVRTEQMK